MPVVMYASRPNIKLDPCRKAVHDPDLVDINIGKTIFSSWDIFNPLRFKENLITLRTFIEESNLDLDSHEDWRILKEPSDLQMQRLLAGWEANPTESTHLVGSAELFVPELEELGLSNIPRNIVIHKSLLESDLNDAESVTSEITVSRGTHPAKENVNLQNWKRSFESMAIVGSLKITWPSLRVQHIGDGQRSIRKRYSPDATTLLIEPIYGHIGGSKDDIKVAAGLGFSLMSPPNFEVRIIGLESRVNSLGAI
jgi:hypothetical protein